MKVVFDTNVVISGSFWRGAPFDCLSAWAKGRCEAVVSPILLTEYHETAEEMRVEYPAKKYVPWAEALSASAELVFPSLSAAGTTKDPCDEMILECAAEANADGIVTGDKRHLLSLRHYQGIPILNPHAFLASLAQAN